MITSLIPQLIPILATVLEKTVPDSGKTLEIITGVERALLDNSHLINLETIKNNQVAAQHRSLWVAGWRPAIGWSCAAGIFWLFIGFPLLTWTLAIGGVSVSLPEFPVEILLELTLAMLGMAGLRTFEKLRGVTM